MEGSDGKFYPNRAMTRQETAVILDRLLQGDMFPKAIAATGEQAIQIGWQFGQSTEDYRRSVQQSSVNVLAPRWYFWRTLEKYPIPRTLPL
ncbi:hypothetical protein HMSSN036_21220 [Paenibacillus macerans]|nr:hypothetical protein HMSSN036_21220 [Paenibacillus macerans]